MGIVIGGVVLFAFMVLYQLRYRNDTIYVDTQGEADVINAFGGPPPHVIVRDCQDDCPCRKNSPHYHLIHEHREVLLQHPDSFVALHPIHGVALVALDIHDFASQLSALNYDRVVALVVLHTSVLETFR